MSLLHPTPGEIADRLTIVELKLSAYRKAGKSAARFAGEAAELRNRLVKFKARDKIQELMSRLADINLTIWKAEDEVRAWRSPDGHVKLAEFALRIAKYNDYRSKVIREIDAACGIESVEEKIYA